MRNFDLTQSAEDDLMDIWTYTFEQWGAKQADSYFDRLEGCLDAIGDGSARVKKVVGLHGTIRVLRCQEHYIFFLAEARPIVIAVLHGKTDMIKWVQDRL